MKLLPVLVCLVAGLLGAGAPAADPSSWALEPLESPVRGLQARRLRDTRSGAAMTLYFDPASADTVHAHAPNLARMLAAVASEFGRDAARTRFHAAHFTQDPGASIALGGQGIVSWHMPTDANGRLTTMGRQMVQLALPHEQVHAVQDAAWAGKSDWPLWFSEGQAEWMGARVSRRLFPESRLHDERAAAAREELRAGAGEIDLRGFHRGRIRPDAIRRQVTPEQWADYLRTGREPAVAYVLGEGELEQPKHTGAHYAAAAQVIERVHRIAGPARTAAWFRAIDAEPGAITTERIVALARQETGVDIAAWLDDRAPRPLDPD